MSLPYSTDDGDHSPPKQQAAAEPAASRNIAELVISHADMDPYQEGDGQGWRPVTTPGRLQSDSYFSGNYYLDPSLGEMQDMPNFDNPEPSQSYDQSFIGTQSRLATLRSHSQSFSTPPDTDSEPPRIPLLPPVSAQSAERRRQQNRSAQRAFRERKESYTNRLEDEVTALRAKYDALVEALSGFRQAFLDIERIIEGHRAGSPASGEVEDIRGKGKGRGR